MTYRISYTYTGPSIPDYVEQGARLYIQQSTSWAFEAFKRWQDLPFASDVVLEQWDRDHWVQLMPTPTPTTTPEPTLTELGMGGIIGLGGDPLEDAQLEVEAWQEQQESEACPGCGALPGQGLTPTCSHPEGCGYWRVELAPEHGNCGQDYAPALPDRDMDGSPFTLDPTPEEEAQARAEQERWAALSPEEQRAELELEHVDEQLLRYARG
jgi:hypothetical protein